ncbi:MAG: hypothetical protein WD750_04785 [Gammaproteobacteria bacterium]
MTILLPAALAGMPMTGAAEGPAGMLERTMRAEQLQEIRSNIRASLVPSLDEETDHYANRRAPDNSRDTDHGRRGVIEIIPFPQKRVSFTP